MKKLLKTQAWKTALCVIAVVFMIAANGALAQNPLEEALKVFGAKAGTGTGGAFLTGTLPGVSLNFSPSPDAVVGTQGRSIDHVGFEVRNLEAFCKKLEADGIKIVSAYRKVPALNIAVAFITDPWGTYIELTEGLDKIS